MESLTCTVMGIYKGLNGTGRYGIKSRDKIYFLGGGTSDFYYREFLEYPELELILTHTPKGLLVEIGDQAYLHLYKDTNDNISVPFYAREEYIKGWKKYLLNGDGDSIVKDN